MNAGVLARLLRLVKWEADRNQCEGSLMPSFPLETAREIEAALEEALEAATKREDEERFAKENAEIVETRLEELDAEVYTATENLRDAVERLKAAVNP